MSGLVLHPLTQKDIGVYLQTPSHALLIDGPPGSGKLSLAVDLAEKLLQLRPGTFGDYAHGKIITPPDSRSIGIETVRDLEHFLRLKVPSKQVINRIIIIQDAHLLTAEAQNALLKTIEEPPAGTVLLLTTAHLRALLSTIRSRAQRLHINRPDTAALERHFHDLGFEEIAVKRALAMSGGSVGLTAALLNDTEHPLLSATKTARSLLGQSIFERLTQVDILSRQRDLCLNTILLMQQMASISLRSGSATETSTRRWQNVLTATYQAREALQHGGQIKLVMTQLLLSL